MKDDVLYVKDYIFSDSNEKKSTDDHENSSFVCYGPFMVVLYFAFKK